MTAIPSYGKLTRVGADWQPTPHPDWVFQEKLDGSQLSFMLPPDAPDGPAVIQSKRTDARGNTAFNLACRTIDGLTLTPGVVYRGEFISKPKHNKLAYGSTPPGYIVLFDALVLGLEGGVPRYASPVLLEAIGARLGLVVAPTFKGLPNKGWLTRTSCLGGMIEGWVGKNYSLRNKYGEPYRVKRVSPAFEELGGGSKGPRLKNGLDDIKAHFTTERRWEKAVERLRDDGTLTNTSRDIGQLVKEVQADVLVECEADIREALWQLYGKTVIKNTVKGLAPWYLGLTVASFEEGGDQ